MAIGARSQAARTYLEKFLNDLRVLPFIVIEQYFILFVGMRAGGTGQAWAEGSQGHVAQ